MSSVTKIKPLFIEIYRNAISVNNKVKRLNSSRPYKGVFAIGYNDENIIEFTNKVAENKNIDFELFGVNPFLGAFSPSLLNGIKLPKGFSLIYNEESGRLILSYDGTEYLENEEGFLNVSSLGGIHNEVNLEFVFYIKVIAASEE